MPTGVACLPTVASTLVAGCASLSPKTNPTRPTALMEEMDTTMWLVLRTSRAKPGSGGAGVEEGKP